MTAPMPPEQPAEPPPEQFRPSRVEIDAGAITRNVATLVDLSAPAAVCAVVKADGYGHGLATAARAALDGGATWIGVALVEEAVAARKAGVDTAILVLSEPPRTAWPTLVGLDVHAAVYSAEAIAAAQAAAASAGRVARLHLKVDTGMHRVGCAAHDAVALARAIAGSPSSELVGVFTHLATADDVASLFGAVQLDRYRAVLSELDGVGIAGHLRHASNSAAAIAIPASRFDLVRCGIACYGVPPAPGFEQRVDLWPALRLVSEVSWVKRLGPGEPVSYGCRFVTDRETTIATVPLGYADGLPRSYGLNGGVVLIGGRRVPVVGTVTMDQCMVDVGDQAVARGDEVVLIGRQHDAAISANEVAARLGTIGYEVVSRLGARLPRVVI